MGTAALCASVRFLKIQRAVGAIKTRRLSCFSWILVSYEFLIKIFNISLVYWRNTALSSLAIHTVWLRSAALSCTNIPALLIKSFYQELVSTITVGRRIVIKTCTLIRLYDAQHQYHLNQKIPKLDRTGCCCNRNTFHKARSNSCD